MPTNRPFFGSFLSAFRAHTAIQKAATTSSSGSAGTSSQTPFAPNSATTASSTTNSANGPSTARTIATKSGQASTGATSIAIQAAGQFHPTRQHSASPYSRSPGSPGSGTLTPLPSRGRRGSDSSSEGFKEANNVEKLYIGGRTAAGEERFYKLSMVRRPRSIDRLSLDRMSL